MKETIPTDVINEGLRGALELIPLVYVIIVVMSAIAFGIVKFNGETVKNHKLYIIAIALCLAVVAYYFYPDEQVKVRDIPTLIVGCIASLFTVQLFVYWRKKKSKNDN